MIMSKSYFRLGFWTHRYRGYTDDLTSASMEDENIVLVRIEVGGVGDSVDYVEGAIVVHVPVVASDREGVERLSVKEVMLLRH